MTLFKGKKKKTYNKKKNSVVKTTIAYKHNNKIDSIIENNSSIKSLKLKLTKINKNLDDYNNKKMINLSDNEINEKFSLIEEKKMIEEKIKKIESQSELNNYMLNTSHMLFHYFDENFSKSPVKNINKGKNRTVLDFFGKKKKEINNNVKNSKIKIYNKKNKNEIMDSYLSYIEKDYIKKTEVISQEDLDNCNICKIPRIYDSNLGCMICSECGSEEKILIDCDTPSYKEPPREITYFAYKKINHANEWLSQFQAKESTDISEKIFEKIQNELKKESYLNLKKLTSDKVRDILKKLDLTKYYEHCHYITNRITGKPAPVINGELEEKLRNMFKEIQGPWMKYCPSDRSNFFSYPYIFYKFFQLLDKDEYLPYCRLLKSREKLQEHDEVWKKICGDLRWQYIPTV